jgi:hypothetical protein
MITTFALAGMPFSEDIIKIDQTNEKDKFSNCFLLDCVELVCSAVLYAISWWKPSFWLYR